MKKILYIVNKNAFVLLMTWVLILSVLYSCLSIVRHDTFQSGAFDLGIYDQAVWQYSRFQFPYNTIKDRFILADHLTLTLPLLAPLFWIWDDARMLLIFQSFWVSISAIPLFLLIKYRGYSGLVAFNLGFIYSLFYGLQFLVFFDFHPVSIAVGIIPWMLYCLEAGKRKAFIVLLLLFLLTQENMGIALASIGFIYLFQKKYRNIGIYFIVGGIIVSILSALVIKYISPIGFEYTPQVDLNGNLLVEFFDAEEKRIVWLYSYSWFSFIPLLSPGSVLGVLLDMSQYFVTGEALSRMWSPFTHHRALLGILLALGVLDGFSLIKKIHSRFSSKIPKIIQPMMKIEVISVMMVFVALLFQLFFHFPLNKLSKTIYWQNEQWMENNKKMLSFIEKDASVATAQSLVPHLSHRNRIYLLYPRQYAISNNVCNGSLCWWLDFAGKPKYMLVDTHPNQWVTQLLESNEHFLEAVQNMEHVGRISLVKNIGDARLYLVNY